MLGDVGNMLSIVDLSSLEIIQRYKINKYKVMNTINNPFKQLIYVVNNEGVTDILTYTLEYITSIKNPCLKQAFISYDVNFVYSICPNDIIVYNGISFEQQFPTINHGISEAKQQNRTSENIYTKNTLDQINKSLQTTEQILSLVEIEYLDGQSIEQMDFIQEQDTNTVQYLCDTLFLNNVEILDCVNASFYFQANSIVVQNLNIKNLETSLTVIDIQAIQINITDINIKNIYSHVQGEQINFINIKSFSDAYITRINSNDSQISILSINQQRDKGKALVSEIIFLDFQIFGANPLISLNDLQFVKIQNVQIKNVVNSLNKYMSIFSMQNCDTVNIIDSQFVNNTNINGPGGVIYAIENKVIIIQNSRFQLNTCKQQNGGAIYIQNKILMGILHINSSQFIENKALLSSGGAIYQQNNNIIIQNTEISSNIAQIGGGIYYTQILPDFLIDLKHGNSNNNTFIDNVGYIYGQNFGSTLRKVYIDLENIELPSGSQKSQQNGDIQIHKFKSGDQINFKKIQLLDEEDNHIKFDNINLTNFNLLSSDVQSLLQQISISIAWDQENEQIQCIGQLQTKQYQNGGYSLDVQVFYKPIANIILKIVSNIFPQIKDSQGNIVVNSGQIELNVKIELDQCSIGEIFVQYGNSIACQQCPEGKYSLSLNDKECKECPDSATSCKGSIIQLKSGYWRVNENTDNILYCSLNPLPCQPQLPTSKFNCDEGYKGPMCQCCDTYGKIWGESYAQMFNPSYCYQCSQNKIKIIAFNLLIFILISSYVLFILKRIIMQQEFKIIGYYLNKLDMIYLGSTLNQSDRSQIISKILTDHLQILSFVCTFTVNMPISFTLPIQLSGNTFTMTSKSIDCVFSNYPNLQPLWLFQSLWTFCLPLGISCMYLLIGIICNFFKVNIFIKYFRTAALFIYFYFFPMVINLASRSINCITIGDKKYLDLDLSIECFDASYHKPYIFFYSIPVIIIWGILIPVYLFYKIYSTKQKKQSIFMTMKYSFFFAGYKEKYYYWEFWKLFYKTNLILVSELLKQNFYIKVGIMNLVLLFQFYLLVKSKPFTREYFNNLQQKSIILCTFSLNLCFILIVGVQNDLGYQMILILLVVFANIFYIFILLIGLSRLLIPTQEEDRNFIQNIIFQITKKYPQLLDVQLQNKQKIKSLLKLRKVKLRIKQLMKYLKGYDFYSSQSLQSYFNINKSQNQSNLDQVQEVNQIFSSEFSDEKHLIQKNKNNIQRLRNKWSYYTRNAKSNQTSLKTSSQNLNPINYGKDDYIMETQNSLQNSKNNRKRSTQFQIQLSEHQN
ncbi:transmembrane protein, putative (macronuclear) [Tetrahymena thermophila SB210]|uniref:Transmembrane protein, putative n=1 Tax=Tetrahymena thermophila (strain SB210) TaxID=312017 RepID=Q22SN7_TETTS|nr:transmembrane protein, putative [Tetrahymena thermophila SB210]EAR88298.4 transmembrane protein, putative [Tetrahymena thermophila SB210]|eukprot:XP_001008543.4 transmembrane protein, putative [Tetrahymena thermophila SB210]